MALCFDLSACSAPPSPVVVLPAPAVSGEPAAPAGSTALAFDSLALPPSEPTHSPGRGKSGLARCEPLFFQEARSWIRTRLPRADGDAFDAYCDPLETMRRESPLPMPRAEEDPRREEEAAAARIAQRDAAVRALERDAAAPGAPPIVSLALGYLLAERAYEEARAASWQCVLCELGSPNVWSGEAFFAFLRGSRELQRAIGLFDATAERQDDVGWMAGFFALRTRSDGGLSDAKDVLSRLASEAPPPGSRVAVQGLALTALQKGMRDQARAFLGQLAGAGDAPPGARLWLLAFEQRRAEVLRLASEILAARPLRRARDVLALGVLVAEREGLDAIQGAPDGKARIALACAQRALRARDAAGARHWLDWIQSHAADAPAAPLLLEALARSAVEQGEGDLAARARAAVPSDASPLGTGALDMIILQERVDDAALHAVHELLDRKR